MKKVAGQYKDKTTAIILAGGKGLRFGADKSMLAINGRTMIEHIVSQLSDNFNQILIGSDNIEKYSFLGYKVIPDKNKGYGPLMGILSCLEESDNNINFVIACDIPDVNMNLVKSMLDEIKEYDIVVPRLENGFIEPLFAVYRKSVTNSIYDILYSTNRRRIRDLFGKVKTKYLKVENISDWYRNINTQEDFKKYIN